MKHKLKYIIGFIMLIGCFTLKAQQALTNGDIIVKTAKSPHKGRVVLKEIQNLRDDTVLIKIINEYEKPGKREALKVLKPRQKTHWDVTFNVIKASLKNTNTSVEIFRYGDGKKEGPGKSNVKKQTERGNDDETGNAEASDDKDIKTETNDTALIIGFYAYLNSRPFLSDSGITADSVIISGHLANLNLASIDKSAYIEECVKEYVMQYNDSLEKYTKDSMPVVEGYLGSIGIEYCDTCKNMILAHYLKSIARRKVVIAPLEKVIEESKADDSTHIGLKTIIVCGCIVLLCVVLAIWYWRVNKRSSVNKKMGELSVSTDESGPALVVVGTKSTTTLKKQSLEDVYDNESFIKIDTGDFCENSLVRYIYIKNSCIKEIYNMYAEDLRNPENPKEDGCMVLGRWVYDEKNDKYDISLEYTIMPGDDAVFTEYELNFGGKIKLRMSEKLRKLRKETGLQYDLTCWVHSHPGLGVFFSNSDNNVHLQLKHPTYPGFLIAFVVDILTPKQDLGIFTFRDTETVNSKGDLKCIYSLEELYNQALQSERSSFDSSNYYDILGDSQSHIDTCYGIQLSNGAIIDMSFMTSKPNGFVGFVHGYTIKRGERTQCVVSVVNGNESSANTEMLGCFVMASHCSIPSIRKAVSKYLRNIHFVLVYTASNGLLTAIPIVDKDLSLSDIYYGEKELEDLKIWTRRRR